MKFDMMNISKVFSARSITLLLFIFVALLVGTMFPVKLGPEPFTEVAATKQPSATTKQPSVTTKQPSATTKLPYISM